MSSTVMSDVLSLKDRTLYVAHTTSAVMMVALPLGGLHLYTAHITRICNVLS